MKKIIFICDLLSQPRIIKRINSIHLAGLEVKVYGYRRNKYNCNTFPSDIPVTTLGEMQDSSGYLRKLKQTYKDISDIIKENGTKENIYYAFGFFPALFLLMKRAAYIYEISDLLYGYKRFERLRWLFVRIDKTLVKHSLATVMTSLGFKEYLFGNSSNQNIIVIPNKLNEYFLNVSRKPTIFNNQKPIVFAYVGAIRYPQTVLRFARIVGQQFPNHEFHFYGESPLTPECIKLADTYKNVKYFGAFKNPEDLERIYSIVDMLVTCYETENLNERIAEPNKLYEALFFCKPIIVSTGTFLSKQVENYQCGFAINAYKDEEIIRLINSLTIDQLNSISKHESSLATDELVNNQDILNTKIKELAQ